jgi:hypothetical protein
MRFYLGTHMPNWLNFAEVPLFVSDRTLKKYKKLPEANCIWALDSGAFSELSMYGEYQTTAKEYADRIDRYVEDIGKLQWAAPQDWMCEPFMLKKTGLSLLEHQTRTIDNLLTLRSLTDSVPFIPVLQGWLKDDYHSHIEQYQKRGIEITSESVVGLGSVCRRQGTEEIRQIVHSLRVLHINLHGFGVKTRGLQLFADSLISADSLAWSFTARRLQYPFFEECRSYHINCANCFEYAMHWRKNLLEQL